jgi:hypothetical protein
MCEENRIQKYSFNALTVSSVPSLRANSKFSDGNPLIFGQYSHRITLKDV